MKHASSPLQRTGGRVAAVALKRGLHLFVLLALGIALSASVLVRGAIASSHSEAPGTAKDRLADDTDLYAFVSPDAPHAVTFVGLWIPLLEPNGGPNFYVFDDEAHYYVNIDNVGDCLDHLRYEFNFTTTRQNGNTFLYNTGVVTSLNDPDLNVRQTYSVTRVEDGVDHELATGLPVAPNYVGPVSMPDYASLARAAVQTLSDGTKVFCGPRDDPFFVDLAGIFDLLTIRRLPGNKGRGIDGLAGYNAMAIVLQVPFERLTRDGQAPKAGTSVLGIYDSTERNSTRIINADGTASISGPELQVSRLGMPLVNEVVIPLQDKDKFNATKPTGDGAFLNYVTNPELPGLLHAIYGISVPPTPRNDLVAVFLKGVPGLNENGGACEMVRLNMLIPPARKPNRFAVLKGDLAGFPNGRRLGDDIVDIELRVVAGVLVPGFDIKPNRQLGDGVDYNDVPFLPYFPYVALPHNPLDHSHEGTSNQNQAVITLQDDGSTAADDDDADVDSSHGTAGTAAAAPQSKLDVIPDAGAASRLLFTVPRQGHVALELFDARGRRVRSLVNQDAAPGTFATRWDGRDDTGSRVAGGMYFARLSVDGQALQSHKVLVTQ